MTCLWHVRQSSSSDIISFFSLVPCSMDLLYNYLNDAIFSNERVGWFFSATSMRLGRREHFAILHTSPQMVTISVSHYWSRLRHPTTNKGRRLSETCAHP